MLQYKSVSLGISVIKDTVLLNQYRFLGIFLLAIVSTVASTIGPPLVQRILDNPNESSSLNIYFPLFVVSTLCSTAARFVASKLIYHIALNAERSCRQRGLTAILNMPWNLQCSYPPGTLAATIEKGSRAVWSIINVSFGTELLFSCPILFGILTVTLIKVPGAYWMLFLPILFYLITSYLIEGRKAKLQSNLPILHENAVKRLYETLANISTVKCFQQEQFETERYMAAWKLYQNKDAAVENWNFIRISSQTAVDVLLKGLVIMYGIMNGLSTGTITMLVTYQGMVLNPLRVFTASMANLHQQQKIYSPLHDLISADFKVADEPHEISPLTDTLRFKNVSFGFGNTLLLKKLNFTVPSKRVTVIVGENGAGKSTILSLILKFYRPQNGMIMMRLISNPIDIGCILWDGQPLENCSLKSLYKQIAFVPQECHIFNASVKENICYGKDVPLSYLQNTLKRVGLNEFVSHLPEKEQTIIGNETIQLSGGQIQRMCIARALIHEPSLILYDESSSNLDELGERNFLSTVCSLKGHVTQIIISHKKSALEIADQVLELCNGEIRVVQSTANKKRD